MFGPSPYPQPYANPFQGLPTNSPSVPVKQTEQLQPKEASLPRYVNYLADYSGCGHWRILWPENVINAEGMGMSQSTTAMVTNPV